ncbi:MAG: peptidoglycan DD-metalloendopeptidase family protein [Erythrobacter sp.]|uniref:murein hydrolase activator EnvC family protein n=1 Tax=Erythrobacter sp. TaxID=1042 RepID=UPI002630CC39|nr:peptidoglycan DD-metalloendopeptidase family protein [Erythrobacter sp.]MDJ0978431.1 peptidoglycan DD-metalloendopeptidase family protein [Erythrobacter sp.]
MVRQSLLVLMFAAATFGALAASVSQSGAQRPVAILAPDEAREQLARATKESEAAQERAARFAKEAEEAEEATDRTAREVAALAARIQTTEADIAAARARYSLAQLERATLARRLASRQEPLVALTAALQTNARRPLALSAFQPGSLKDVVYVRAVLDSAVPQIQERTAALRSELEEGRRLERRARRALTELRASEKMLEERRVELAAAERQARLDSSVARGNAAREQERALALAEEARDLDGLVERLDEAARLRARLARLPGPILRPGANAEASGALDAQPTAPEPSPSPTPGASLAGFQLPVQGRTVTGFGEQRASGLRSKGLALLPQPGAQIVAPADGRVAFSGPYEGFGRIVILEHKGGWTSLVTGLARADVAVGDALIAGSPMGVADSAGGVIAIELRRDGEPVNPLDHVR